MKRLGPELKMPEAKMPKVLTDLYGDLRDRRLLPLVALLIVGIVAAPILLGESPADEEEPAADGAVVATKSKYAQIDVVEATPGLRDYHERLKGKPTDPFKQKYTSPVLSGSDLPESSETGEADKGEGSGDGSGGSGSGGSGSGGSGGGQVKYYEWVIKIQISRTETDEDGNSKMGPPKTRDGVKSLTPLPGKKAPVITFIGINPKNGKALVSVSSEVSSTFGEAHCVAGADRCDLLEIEAGFPVTFEYGPNAVRYRFKLISIDLIPVGKS